MDLIYTIPEKIKEAPKLPTLEEIKNNLGNEFTLRELKEHYKEFKILSLSALLDNYIRNNKISMNYEKIENGISNKYKIVP